MTSPNVPQPAAEAPKNRTPYRNIDERVEASCTELQARAAGRISHVLDRGTVTRGGPSTGPSKVETNIANEIGGVSASFYKVLGPADRLEKMRSLTEIEQADLPEYKQTKAMKQEMRLRPLQLSVDPALLRDSMEEANNDTPAFDADANFSIVGAPPPPPPAAPIHIKFDIGQQHSWIGDMKSIDDFKTKITAANTNTNTLAAIGLASADPTTLQLDTLTPAGVETAARECMKALVSRHLRPRLAEGGASEFNVQSALALVVEEPDLFGALHGKSDHEREHLEELEGKRDIVDLLKNGLAAISTSTLGEDYQTARRQYGNVSSDIDNFRDPGATFTSNYFKKKLGLNSHLNVTPLNDTDKDKKLDLAEKEKDRLKKACDFYLSVEQILGRLRGRISRIHGMTDPPALLAFFTGAKINHARLNSSLNPGTVADDIIAQLHLKKTPEEYKSDIDHAKEHYEDAKKDDPKGMDAILKIYEKHFEKLAGSEAKEIATQTFWRMEFGKQEADQIDDHVHDLAGGELRFLSERFRKAKEYGKSLFYGSQENFVCSIAESK